MEQYSATTSPSTMESRRSSATSAVDSTHRLSLDQHSAPPSVESIAGGSGYSSSQPTSSWTADIPRSESSPFFSFDATAGNVPHSAYSEDSSASDPTLFHRNSFSHLPQQQQLMNQQMNGIWYPGSSNTPATMAGLPEGPSMVSMARFNNVSNISPFQPGGNIVHPFPIPHSGDLSMSAATGHIRPDQMMAFSHSTSSSGSSWPIVQQPVFVMPGGNSGHVVPTSGIYENPTSTIASGAPRSTERRGSANQGASTTATDPDLVSTSTSDTPSSRRVPHSLIERRYRQGLQVGMQRLREAIPSLRNGPTSHSECQHRRRSRCRQGSECSAGKTSKLTILANAVVYLKQLEREVRRLQCQNRSILQIARNHGLEITVPETEAEGVPLTDDRGGIEVEARLDDCASDGDRFNSNGNIECGSDREGGRRVTGQVEGSRRSDDGHQHVRGGSATTGAWAAGHNHHGSTVPVPDGQTFDLPAGRSSGLPGSSPPCLRFPYSTSVPELGPSMLQLGPVPL